MECTNHGKVAPVSPRTHRVHPFELRPGGDNTITTEHMGVISMTRSADAEER